MFNHKKRHKKFDSFGSAIPRLNSLGVRIEMEIDAWDASPGPV